MRHFTIGYSGPFRLANSFRVNGLTFQGGLRKYAREHGIAGALLCSGNMLLFERDAKGSVCSKTLKAGTFTATWEHRHAV